MNEKDYFRFMHNLYEFNDEAPAPMTSSYFFNKSSVIARRKPRILLVDIHAFCLMPNHYHLMLSPKVDNAIPRFMKKLNMGYARYFNEKYDRTGALFEGRYKSVAITNESHFLHLPNYIHFNPLDLITPEWRDNKIKDFNKSINFLENYRWSSFLDYIGIKNFPSITTRTFLSEVFNGKDNYKKYIVEWLKNLNLEHIIEIKLES